MGGIPEFHRVIVDVQVNRVVGDILKDDAVVPGVFEFRSEVSARVGRADCPGKGRFGYGVVAAGGSGTCAGEGPGHEDQFVVRSQGIAVGIALIAVIFGA